MKEIKQGTLYGFEIVLKVPDEVKLDETLNENTLENYVKNRIRDAVESFKEQQKFINLTARGH